MVQALPAAAPRKQQLEAARQKCSLAAGGLAACQFGMACGLQPAACSLQPAACIVQRSPLKSSVWLASSGACHCCSATPAGRAAAVAPTPWHHSAAQQSGESSRPGSIWGGAKRYIHRTRQGCKYSISQSD